MEWKEGLKELNKKLKEQKKQRDKDKQEHIEEINSYIDSLKAKRYVGLISAKDIERYFRKGSWDEEFFFSEYVVKDRNDIVMVNSGQYKLIYDNVNDSTANFSIEPNQPFYKRSEMFENKKQLIEFLDKSKKVYVNEDMFFVPFKYKQDDKFYLLVVNNVLENIEAYQLNSLNYLNKQHNVYYIIETNKADKFKDIRALKDYIIRTCQRYTNYNSELLYRVYSKVDNFKKEKTIVKQYN